MGAARRGRWTSRWRQRLLHQLSLERSAVTHTCSCPLALPSSQAVSYKGDVEAREAVWTRQLRGGRGGGAGGGAHVVLCTYDSLMNKSDK